MDARGRPERGSAQPGDQGRVRRRDSGRIGLQRYFFSTDTQGGATSTTAEVHGNQSGVASGSGGRAAGGVGANVTSRGRPPDRAGAPRAGPRAAGAPPAPAAAAAPRRGRAAALPPAAAPRAPARGAGGSLARGT